jgi:exodeoxyribonuclease-1
MAGSFFFYDLETSGFRAQSARIMQFAGQRTNMELKPVGDPVNLLIKLTPDVLPDPDAVLVTGITPQMTIDNGVTEVEFLRFFHESICLPETVFLGYNSVRFDDDFMRHLFYRNFYDAYRWQWCDDCSRWDLLDMVRMMRALRPEGITWPFASDGSPSNRLGLLTSVNALDHANAHDALSDVNATIALAKLIKDKQPKLFSYLFDMRRKQNVKTLVEGGQPFVYTSGAYPSEFLKTTAAIRIAADPNKQESLVYDLRYDPNQLATLSVKQIAERWRWRRDRKPGDPSVPVKTLRYNRCPAVAPLTVVDAASCARINLDMNLVEANRKQLINLPELGQKLLAAQRLLSGDRPQSELLGNENEVDGQLYDGFIDPRDAAGMGKVQAASAAELATLDIHFYDNRLSALLPLYKARNFPSLLTSEERDTWEAFRLQRLLSGGARSRMTKYCERLQVLIDSPGTTKSKRYLLEELRLYGESIAPAYEELPAPTTTLLNAAAAEPTGIVA